MRRLLPRVGNRFESSTDDRCKMKRDAMQRDALILCLLSLLVVGLSSAQETHTSQNSEAYIDIRSSGAVGDGVNDDTQAIATAAKSCGANGGTLYLPHSRAAYTTSRTVDLPADCDMEIDGVLKATAAMEAVVTIGSNGTAYRHRIFGLGTIDSENLAKRHISMADYGHFEITGITLLNGASIAGIDIGPEGSRGGYEAYIHDMNLFVPHGVAHVAGNAGIWAHKGTDSSVYNLAIVGWDTGVRNNIHNNQPFANIHVWGFGPNPGWKNISNLPSVCFDDIAGDAQWLSDECDTPTQIGLHAHGYNDQITGFSCYNNEIWGSDNVVNCIQFDLPTPYSSVMNSIFQGKKGHRLASDVQVASDNYTQIVMVGNVSIAHVAKTRAMTAHLSNIALEGTLNLGGPVSHFGKGELVFSNTAGGGYRFEVAGVTVAEITSAGVARFPGGVEVGHGESYHAASETAAPAAASSMGCLDGLDHLPCTVAKLSPKTMMSTSPIPPTTVFTTVASMGVYQVIVTFHSLGGSVGGTATPVAVLGQLSAPGTAASMASAGVDGVSTASIALDEGPGVALGYALKLSGARGDVHYAISMEVVRLQ
jgi:hypothetical protein